MRTHQRSLRIEDENIYVLDALPRGTVNTFINELIRVAKNEPSILEQVILSDERFKDWRMPEQPPNKIVDKTSIKPAKPPKRSALPVKQSPITIVAEEGVEAVESELIAAIPGAEQVEDFPLDPEAKKAKEQAEIEAAVAKDPDSVAMEELANDPEFGGKKVDGAAEFDKAIPPRTAPNLSTPEGNEQFKRELNDMPPVQEPVETVEKPAPQPAPAAKSTLDDLFPGMG